MLIIIIILYVTASISNLLTTLSLLKVLIIGPAVTDYFVHRIVLQLRNESVSFPLCPRFILKKENAVPISGLLSFYDYKLRGKIDVAMISNYVEYIKLCVVIIKYTSGLLFLKQLFLMNMA